MQAFIPEGGDLIWFTLDPQARHEQAGRRPALILSPKAYNQKIGARSDLPGVRPDQGLSF
jgi:mRNA interferase MazF